jgi:hypothetical protein
MKKNFCLLLFSFLAFCCKAQLYIAKAGTLSFYSEAPLENIEGISKNANAVLNTQNGEIAVIVSIRSFQFKKALMQEHFNEKYLESDKYKEATFKGIISGLVDYSKDGAYPVTASGTLNMHGIEKKYTVPGTITVKGTELLLACKFNVLLQDHKIEVPFLVAQKIAEKVLVSMNVVCLPYKKN